MEEMQATGTTPVGSVEFGQQEEVKTEPIQLKWKKTGGGSFRLASGKIIKPNQIFEATIEEIPKSFRDVVICLDEIAKKEIKKNDVLPQSVQYEVRPRSSQGTWFDLINMTTGKPINENALRKADAEKMKIDLVGTEENG